MNTAADMVKTFTTPPKDGLSAGVGELAGQIGEALVCLILALPGLAVLITCRVLRSRERKRLEAADQQDHEATPIGD